MQVALLAQHRVADFEGLAGDVRAEGEQLRGGRGALGARQVGAQPVALGKVPDRAGRDRERRKAPPGRAFFMRLVALVTVLAVVVVGKRFQRGNAHVLVAQADVELPAAEVGALDPEQGPGLGLRAGHVGLVADRIEIDVGVLQAESAGPAVPGRVPQFQPDVVGIAVENRADLRALELGVGVVGIHELDAEPIESPERIGADDLGVPAAGVEPDRDEFLLFVVLVRMFLGVVRFVPLVLVAVVVMRAGDAVVAAVVGPGQAEAPAVADPAGAERAAVVVQEAVLEDAARALFVHLVFFVLAVLLLLGVELGGARDFVVVGAPVERTGVERETAASRIDSTRGEALVGGGVDLRHRAGVETVLGHRLRNRVRNDVDDAADGAGAVEQGRGTAQDLDLVRQEGLDRHRVILADRRCVAGRHVVVQHAHALSLESADHRPAHVLAKTGVGQARLAGQGLADVVREFTVEGLAAQHRGRLGQLGLAAPQRRRPDDDFLELVVGVVGAVFVVVRRRLLGVRGDGAAQRGKAGARQRHARYKTNLHSAYSPIE